MSSENWLVFIPYIYIHIHIIYTHIDTKIVIIMYIFYVCCVSIRTYYVTCGLHVVCVCVFKYQKVAKPRSGRPQSGGSYRR